MKKSFRSWMVLGIFVFSSMEATTMNVTVRCTTGQRVSNLPIVVKDYSGTVIPGATQTDEDGVFQIADVESYTIPMSIYYNMDECGPNYIATIGETIGLVSINYYPVDAPCSCAQLVPPAQPSSP